MSEAAESSTSSTESTPQSGGQPFTMGDLAGAETPQETTPPQENATETPQESSGQPFTMGDLAGAETPQETTPPQEEQEYKLSINETHKVNPDFLSFVTEKAKSYGFKADAMSSLLNETFDNLRDGAIKEQEMALDALKKEWGADFLKRCNSTKQFTLSIASAVGLTDADSAFLSSPRGYRLMYGLSKLFSESKAVAPAASVGVMSKEQRLAECRDMQTNPKNPYYDALNKQGILRAERVKAWKRYNELRGIAIYPEA